MSNNIQRILIPVDFGEPSVKAVQYASRLAAKTDAHLFLLYVIDTPGLLAQFFQSTNQLVKITDQAKDQLLMLADKVKQEFPGLNITTRIETGKPYQKILEFSKELKVQMIILGANHKSSDPEDDLGTTVYHVTLKSRIPVLTLNEDLRVNTGKIVVPLDLTKETREQLTAAIFFGREYKAKIYLVSALIGGIEKSKSRIWKKLEDAKQTLELNGLECEMKVFDRSEVPPFQRVLEYLKEIDADMILLMTHQEGYTYDNYIGAFAHHIMNRSVIPVLTLTSMSDNTTLSPFLKTMVDPLGVIFRKNK